MRRSCLIVSTLLLAACGSESPPPPAAPAASYTPLTVDLRAPHQFNAEIRAEDLARRIARLSSDEFEGREPGTLGERLTLAYLESELTRIGFLPAVPDGNPCPAYPCAGATFTQRVPMVSVSADPATTLQFQIGDATETLHMGTDMVVGARAGEALVELKDNEVVFVGYGVNAPEQNWNDYAGLDVKGKTVVILVNDPGFLRKDPALFKGRAMTYYGRWTYKFEEAARQGAAAALIIHDTEPAAYGWDVVKNGWTGPQHDLPASEDPSPKVRAAGWLHLDAARALFAASGQDLDALRLAADAPGFKPVPLSARLSLKLHSTISSAYSNNVVAILPGASRPEESVLFSGHWDHLGKSEGGEGEDHIFNGAIDNANGVAAALEIAEAFAGLAERPARSVMIFLPTLEESGLLGSRYYVEHPLLPLAKLAGVVNMDALPMIGRTRDFAVSGFGQNELQDLLATALASQDRVVKDEPAPEKGYYFRSDHFNFANKGVPALHARAGYDQREQGEVYGRAQAEDYVANRYHKPSDQYDPNWDYAGLVEDVQAYYAIGRKLSEVGYWPEWKQDSEFKALREQSASERQ
ncbi:MAG: M28 family metallopeptidase [Lysobacterales bacterium]